MNLLHYFQDPTDQQLSAKLSEIMSMAMKLWSALRKDSCRVDFDYDTSTGDWQECDFVDDVITNRSRATILRNEISVDELPSKPFVLFPRIVGYFEPDYANPRILHTGLALPHDSPAFREGLEEIKHIEQATKEFKRSLRRGSNAQSSPVIGKRQGDWPAPSHGYNWVVSVQWERHIWTRRAAHQQPRSTKTLKQLHAHDSFSIWQIFFLVVTIMNLYPIQASFIRSFHITSSQILYSHFSPLHSSFTYIVILVTTLLIFPKDQSPSSRKYFCLVLV